MSESQFKGRNFLITLNQVERFDELKKYIERLKSLTYAIATKEVAPSTGHEHIHVYCQFGSPTALAKAKLCDAHVDKCKGSAQQNIEYIKKTKDPSKRGKIIWEIGAPKLKGGVTIKEVEEMSKEERRYLPAIYYKTIERINAIEDAHVNVDDFFKEVEVRYIFGGSGMGKTYFAKQWLCELGLTKFSIVSYRNGFWTGVHSDALFALYDDFRDSDLPGAEFVRFIDYTVKNMNVKGSYVKNKYRYIAITSIQDPRDIYGHEWEEKRQWLRRMKVYQFTAYKQYSQLSDEELDI